MPGLACLNRLSAEEKSKSSPVCDCTTSAHALQRGKVCSERAGYSPGAWTGAAVGAGGHQNVYSWQQSNTWCVFSTAWFQTGPVPPLCFRRGTAWCFFCCCFLVLSLMPVAFIFTPWHEKLLFTASFCLNFSKLKHTTAIDTEIKRTLLQNNNSHWACQFAPAGTYPQESHAKVSNPLIGLSKGKSHILEHVVIHSRATHPDGNFCLKSPDRQQHWW